MAQELSIEPSNQRLDTERVATDLPLPSLEGIEHIFLDMDGTLLDLAFDNHFWLHLVPQWYAEHHDLSLEESQQKLAQWYHAKFGTLDWYCADFWSELLGFDVAEKTQKHSEGIRIRPGTLAFLEHCQALGKKLHLTTNAHPSILAVKLQKTGIKSYFDSVHSSHPLGVPKEDAVFWERLKAALELTETIDFAKTLFIDDADRILQIAQDCGVGHLISIRQPDSGKQEVVSAQFPSVNFLDELVQ